MALGRAPGAGRGFAFQQWPSFNAQAWETKVDAAHRQEHARPESAIVGTDINAGSLGVARRNARRAGVAEFISLDRQDIRALAPPPHLPSGLVVSNLPYGKRVGQGEPLEGLYQGLGQTLRAGFSSWRWALLIPDDDALQRALNLPAAAQHRLSNGGIDCRLLLSHAQP
jgi:putative N6-adenine-specific DNA methylase